MKRKLMMVLGLLLMGVTASAQFRGQQLQLDPNKSLKDSYKNYFMIGVAVNQRNITDAEQSAIVKKEFNSITAENANGLGKELTRLLISAARTALSCAVTA